MGKKGDYANVLSGLVSKFISTDDRRAIIEYLALNSNLPGPRGNLELAYAFADVVGKISVNEPVKMWALVQRLTSVSEKDAPVNHPMEIVPFCGAVGIGAIGSVDKKFAPKAFALLRKMAGDLRWRTREGVAMGLQRLFVTYGSDVIKELEGWIEKDDWLAMRAVAAGVAEPAPLRIEENALGALALHKRIFIRIIASEQRNTDEFRVLRQSLGYSLGVVISAVSGEGFAYLHQLAESKDADLRWIVKENLKKSRLIKRFPDEVAVLTKILS